MARGRRPKPTHLRPVDGTHRPTRHGEETNARALVDHAATAFGPLKRPAYLKRFAEAWERYVRPASWLDGSREATGAVHVHTPKRPSSGNQRASDKARCAGTRGRPFERLRSPPYPLSLGLLAGNRHSIGVCSPDAAAVPQVQSNRRHRLDQVVL